MAVDTGNRKFFEDISKPGKVPAEATSRPIIVTNRTMVKDPTLKHEDEPDPEIPADTDKEDAKKKPVNNEAKPLTPLDKGLEREAKPKESEKEEADNTDKDSEEAGDDQVKPGEAQRKEQAELTEAEKAQKEKIDKLIASGKYALPISHVKRNRKQLMIVILVVLIGLVGVDLLVDAKIIKTSINPPINLIKN